MKKSLIALASLAALGAAHADVTLYGLIDASAVSISAGGNSDSNNPANVNFLNSYASGAAGAYGAQTATTFSSTAATASYNIGNGANQRVTTVGNGLLSGSRWGIKGSEDIGSGMKANFVLESALNIATGSNPNDHLLLSNYNSGQTGAGDSGTNGQMFDRQSTVGLSGDFGSIDIGFQPNANIDANASIDVFGLGGISPVGFYSSWNGGGSSYTNKASNSFKYKYTMGKNLIEAFYAMGGVSGNAGAGSQMGIFGKVQATDSLTLTVAASRMNDDVSYNTNPQAIYNTAITNAYNKDSGVNVPYKYTTTSTAGILGYVPGLAATYYNSTTTIFGGTLQATPTLNLKAGYITITQSNASNPGSDILIFQNNGIPINPNAIVSQGYNTNQTRTIGFLGGTYDITPTNHWTVGYYKGVLGAYTANTYGGNGGTGITQAYAALGYNYIASSYVIDLSKKTNVYLAASWESLDSQGTVNKTPSATASNTTAMNQSTSAGTTQTMVAAGLRVSF
jgi:predicted porin